MLDLQLHLHNSRRTPKMVFQNKLENLAAVWKGLHSGGPLCGGNNVIVCFNIFINGRPLVEGGLIQDIGASSFFFGHKTQPIGRWPNRVGTCHSYNRPPYTVGVRSSLSTFPRSPDSIHGTRRTFPMPLFRIPEIPSNILLLHPEVSATEIFLHFIYMVCDGTDSTQFCNAIQQYIKMRRK